MQEGEDALKREVVHVLTDEGDLQVRLASVDAEGRRFVLHEVSLEGGGEARIINAKGFDFESICSVDVQGRGLRLQLRGASGRAFLELRFVDPELASRWARCLRRLVGGGGGVGQAVSGGDGGRGQMAATLRKLVAQQEEQARILEELNNKKHDQICQVQARLESALEMLQQGQMAYVMRQRMVVEQQEIIDALKSRAQATAMAEAACNNASLEAQAGWRRAAKARRAGGGVGQAANVAGDKDEE